MAIGCTASTTLSQHIPKIHFTVTFNTRVHACTQTHTDSTTHGSQVLYQTTNVALPMNPIVIDLSALGGRQLESNDVIIYGRGEVFTHKRMLQAFNSSSCPRKQYMMLHTVSLISGITKKKLITRSRVLLRS
jgi:hypothetical protein